MTEIVIVPTSHVARESIKTVKKAIHQEKPDCVAIELDLNRFVMLESGQTKGKVQASGLWNKAMFYMFKKVSEWLGKMAGIMPGSDMLSAVKAAEDEGVRVAFIDRDIRLTLQGLTGVPWKEKAKLMTYLVKGLTLDRLLAKAGRAKTVEFDLAKVPPKEIIQEVRETMRKEFPNIYSVLLTERDKFMARQLVKLSERFEKIVAVVGAAHEPGIKRILQA
jgi:pheromone shutdown protein TraB